MLADLMVTIGSRAMERIFASRHPAQQSSVLEITPGSKLDIAQATSLMWQIVYQLGMDPGGGVIERSGLKGDENDDYLHRNYLFEPLSDDKVHQLSMVIRDLEDYLVTQLLRIHDTNWYFERISEFAKQAVLTEEQFYQLLEYPFPGENEIFIGARTRTSREFQNLIESDPDSVVRAREFKQKNGNTAAENLSGAMKVFESSLNTRMHSTKHNPDCEADLSVVPKRPNGKGAQNHAEP